MIKLVSRSGRIKSMAIIIAYLVAITQVSIESGRLFAVIVRLGLWTKAVVVADGTAGLQHPRKFLGHGGSRVCC